MKFLFPLLGLLIVSCAAPSAQERYAQLRRGMTRHDVVQLLGEPHSTSASEKYITLEYDFTEEPDAAHPVPQALSPYYIIIGKDDRVRSFGTN
jgi:outer membrane protein assembly factor BamE (lipoprotein component of BamABCDE complex)